jgi:type IV pilus assembly protein PilE
MKYRNRNGFTLMELMITVTIVGILSAIAVPTYNNQVLKSRRAEAKAQIMEIMQREEKYFTESNTYTSNLTVLGYTTNPVLTSNNYYSIAAAANGNGIADGVILTSTPQGNQANDTDCGNFVLNSNGQKSTSGGGATCW